MASGSNAPFSGEFVDLENVPALPKGVSASEATTKRDLTRVRESITDLAKSNELLDLNVSLNKFNFDNGFIDTFFDKSKINTSTNAFIKTGSNGKFKVAPNSTVKGSQIYANNTRYSTTSNSYVTAKTINNINSRVWNHTNKLNSNGDSTLTCYCRVIFNYRDGSSSSVQKSAGTTAGNYVSRTYSNPNRLKKVVSIDVQIKSELSGYEVNEKGDSGTKAVVDSYNTSGSLVHTRKNLGFTPSKIMLTSNFDLNGQTLDAIVSDNSGNSITIPSSDFGTEKSVNFADGNVQIEYSISTDGSKTPIIRSTELLGV